MAKKPAQHFIALSNRFLQSTSTKEKFRMKESDFTRNRKLPFELLALCMLQLLRKSIQSELHLFFSPSVRVITKRSYLCYSYGP